MPALEVLVAQDAAAHDGQIGIAAHEIMGKLRDKIQQFIERRPVDHH